MSRYEISGKVFHIRFYENHEDSYSSSFQMLVDGKVGVIYGLNGMGFFRCIKHHVMAIMTDLGVDVIYFTMMEKTYSALRRSLPDDVKTEIVRHIKAHKRPMLEIKLSVPSLEIPEGPLPQEQK